MARRKVRFVQSHYYHIYNRGARRRSVFLDDTDFRNALQGLKSYSSHYHIAVIAYCLMPNHYHWLIRQDGEISARFLMQYVFNAYVKTFNARHQCSGTLFEGPYHARLVDRADYLLHLCRYIHANPVRHGFATAPKLWSYSNYMEWIGQRPGTLVDRTFIQTHFPDIEQYTASVHAYLQGRSAMPADLQSYLHDLDAA